MASHDQEFEASDLLNSSFYSSNSINALEHSRTFRNSLLLKEMSDNSLNMSVSSMQDMNHNQSSPSKRDERNNVKDLDSSMLRGNSRKDEVQTVNMTTSPSLSALSEILSEKSKNAERMMRTSRIFENSIVEEEEEGEEEGEGEGDIANGGIKENNVVVSSPNLIDMGDSPNGIKFTNIKSATTVEQPDFLTTPKVEQSVPRNQLPNYIIPETLNELEETETYETVVQQNNTNINNNNNYNKRHSVNLATIGKDVISTKKDVNNKKTSLETQPKNKNVDDEQSSKNTYAEIMKGVSSKQSQQHTSKIEMKKTRSNKQDTVKKNIEVKNITPPVTTQKKKKSIFSFLKRKNTRSISETIEVKSSKAGKELNKGMPTSATYSHISSHMEEESEPTEKISKKSHSSNSLFNTLRRKSIGPDTLNVPKAQIGNNVENSMIKQVSDVSNVTEGSLLSVTSSPTKPDSVTIASSTASPQKSIDKNLHSKQNRRNPTPLNFENTLNTPSNDLESEKELLIIPTFEIPSFPDSSHKRDSGEAFFPKLLDADEIDSIVKIERNRSQRSGSLRRRSMDTLSVHAQNEGMTVTTASDIVLSTPDLTKSPTSSILRSGRFDRIDTFPSNNLQSDIDDAFDTNIMEDNQNLLASVEEKLDQLTNDYRKENIYDSQIQKDLEQTDTEKVDVNDDPELMSDIMEFADLINFGEGIDLDVDINQNDDIPEEPFRSTLAPAYIDIDVTKNDIENDDDNALSDGDYDNFISSEQEGLGIQVDQNENNEFNINSEEFDHEDFNDIVEDHDMRDIPPQRKHSILDSDFESNDRPISMSFRGLTGPSLNSTLMNDSNEFQELVVPEMEDEQDQAKAGVTFSASIILYETYGEFEYDRHPDIGTCNQLTPQLAQMIKVELNELKSSMEVHESSKCYTQYF
ncbi:similar to Saccharomyces cerevisiae YNL233W BNI4 Targeting subunit for Glc7p protein phosphatase [Maudiozyma saulgeensis]|uniref:Similar to Saccharomyces cerevisiae YNL233W BNI4 Targeting subunit for Glc7p protein phosphatase n=1 Tax=Maudiozyma saulgeensis TaxID=1789683 RepID=A0A1X7R2E0_9SACH|nr:similar to Saccharomyces cerevisiae YNL233W BNI4 Targeting subunit for Glc7p protein phosphatase [Kazachstania saulgeensis]